MSRRLADDIKRIVGLDDKSRPLEKRDPLPRVLGGLGVSIIEGEGAIAPPVVDMGGFYIGYAVQTKIRAQNVIDEFYFVTHYYDIAEGEITETTSNVMPGNYRMNPNADLFLYFDDLATTIDQTNNLNGNPTGRTWFANGSGFGQDLTIDPAVNRCMLPNNSMVGFKFGTSGGQFVQGTQLDLVFQSSGPISDLDSVTVANESDGAYVYKIDAWRLSCLLAGYSNTKNYYIEVFDLSSDQSIGFLNNPYPFELANDVALSDDYAAVSLFNNTLQIYDVSEGIPQQGLNPVLEYMPDGYYAGIAISGDYLCLAMPFTPDPDDLNGEIHIKRIVKNGSSYSLEHIDTLSNISSRYSALNGIRNIWNIAAKSKKQIYPDAIPPPPLVI